MLARGEKAETLLKIVEAIDTKAITLKTNRELTGYNSLKFNKLLEFLIFKL